MDELHRIALVALARASVSHIWIALSKKQVPKNRNSVYARAYLEDLKFSFTPVAWPVFKSAFQEAVEVAEIFDGIEGSLGEAQ